MSNIILAQQDFVNNIVVPVPGAGNIVLGIGLDGSLKAKNSSGIVTTFGTSGIGQSGTSGTSGVGGNDGSNSLRWAYGNPANVGQFSLGQASQWASVMTGQTLRLNISSFPSLSSGTWLNSIASALTTPNSVMLKVTEVGDANNFGLFKVESITSNSSYYEFIMTVVAKGSSIGPIASRNYTVSWVSIGMNGTSGSSGASGSSGTSGINGINGSSGTSGISPLELNKDNIIDQLEYFPADVDGKNLGSYTFTTIGVTQSHIGSTSSTTLMNNGSSSSNIFPISGNSINIYDTNTNIFNFSNLSQGDVLSVSVDVELTPAQGDQEFELWMEFAKQTPDEYNLYLSQLNRLKTANKVYRCTFSGDVVLINSNYLMTPSSFKIGSGDNLIIKVKRFKIIVSKYSLIV